MKINAMDGLVGLSYDEDGGGSRPTYWSSAGAVAVDLSTAPTNASFWSAVTISDINDNGVISGWGVADGEHDFRPFVIVPIAVPEPAILSILACSTMLVRRARH